MFHGRRTATIACVVVFVGVSAFGCGDASFFSPRDSKSVPVVEPDDSQNESDSREHFGVTTRTASDESIGSTGSRGTATPERMREVFDSLPVYSWLGERNGEERLFVENLLEERVPLVAHVYVHSGGVLLGRVDGTDRLGGLAAGESGARFMPAPKESPERVMDKMKNVLVDQGFSEKRADELLQKRGDDLFRKHGARTVYVAPTGWADRNETLPLGGVSAPLPPWRQ